MELDKIDIAEGEGGGVQPKEVYFWGIMCKEGTGYADFYCDLATGSTHSVHNKYFRLKVIRTFAISDLHSFKPNVNFEPKLFLFVVSI